MVGNLKTICTSASALGMPDSPGLYRIDFPDGRSYVGVSRVSMRKRALNHFTDARRGKRQLVCAALRRHEGDGVFRPLAICGDVQALEMMEQNAIRVYGTLHPAGLNRAAGGYDGGPGKGHAASPEARAKMSASKKNRPRTAAEQNHLIRMSALRGPVTKDQCARISAKLIARGTPNWANGPYQSLPVFVAGDRYNSKTEAAAAFGISIASVSWRIKSPNFSDWSHNG